MAGGVGRGGGQFVLDGRSSVEIAAGAIDNPLAEPVVVPQGRRTDV